MIKLNLSVDEFKKIQLGLIFIEENYGELNIKREKLLSHIEDEKEIEKYKNKINELKNEIEEIKVLKEKLYKQAYCN